jgi:hypothetical protein
MPTKTSKSALSLESINSNVIEAEYAVRGEIVQVRVIQLSDKKIELAIAMLFQSMTSPYLDFIHS